MGVKLPANKVSVVKMSVSTFKYIQKLILVRPRFNQVEPNFVAKNYDHKKEL